MVVGGRSDPGRTGGSGTVAGWGADAGPPACAVSCGGAGTTGLVASWSCASGPVDPEAAATAGFAGAAAAVGEVAPFAGSLLSAGAATGGVSAGFSGSDLGFSAAAGSATATRVGSGFGSFLSSFGSGFGSFGSLFSSGPGELFAVCGGGISARGVARPGRVTAMPPRTTTDRATTAAHRGYR